MENNFWNIGKTRFPPFVYFSVDRAIRRIWVVWMELRTAHK